MKKLQLNFKTQDGKKRGLTLNLIKEDLDPVTIRTAMEKIIKSRLFAKEDLQIYTEVVNAKYVERNEKVVF